MCNKCILIIKCKCIQNFCASLYFNEILSQKYLFLLQHRTFRDFLGVLSNDLFISGDDLEDVDDDTEELVFHLLLL